jgi:hypothetical protein
MASTAVAMSSPAVLACTAMHQHQLPSASTPAPPSGSSSQQ